MVSDGGVIISSLITGILQPMGPELPEHLSNHVTYHSTACKIYNCRILEITELYSFWSPDTHRYADL